LAKLLRRLFGVFLVVIGIIGIIMPVMPGWIFLIPGLVILAEHYAWAKRALRWAREKLEGRNPQRGPEP
jgi:uncharacterized membrane protein YbaN (DUF454 family)